MKQHKDSPSEERVRKDVLDHLEDFIEEHIENNLKKGFDEVERFIKDELLKSPGKGKNGSGPLSYLKTLLEDRNVAAVMPSSKFIIKRVLKSVDWKATRCIVEYGAAEGVITRRLLDHLPPDGTLVAIETNPRFISELDRIHDKRLKVIHGSVMDLERLLGSLEMGPADAIISGIPFSYLKPIERHHLLHKTEERLRPGGRFIAYQITTHLIPLLKYHFQEVDVQYELRNIPPHFVFTACK